MRNVTVTSQVTLKDVEDIDRMVEDGYFCSRSDAIRSFIRQGIGQMKEHIKAVESRRGGGGQ
jgi:Arc/MetJ-type ribon-helix-helix transcriptional regulator